MPVRFPGPRARRTSPARTRRLAVQSLEDRATPAVLLDSAVVIGEAGYDKAEDLAVDAAGNTYVAGRFRSEDADGVDFDPGPGVTNLQEQGLSMAFVAKYAPDGSLAWAWAPDSPVASTTNSSGAIAVATDPAGNVYVTGGMSGTVDFDPGPANTHAGNTDVLTGVLFLVKLNGDGTFAWAKTLPPITSTAQGANPDARDLAVDAAGNAYVAGVTGYNRGVGKFNASGQLQWTADLPAKAVALSDPASASPAVYVAGDFVGKADLDPGPGTYQVGANKKFVSHVTKLTAAGTFTWGAAFVGGTNGFNTADAIAVDGGGNVVTVGTFGTTVDFDPGAGTFNLSPTTNQNAFVVKLTAGGQLVWALRTAGHPDSLALDAAGNMYIAGYFGNSPGTAFDFDPGAGTANLTPIGPEDAYVQRLNADGTFGWVTRVANGRATGVGVDAAGTVSVTGWFSGTSDFDPGAGTADRTAAGLTDIFLWRLDQV